MVISEVGGAAEGAAIWRRWQMQGPQQASAWLALPSILVGCALIIPMIIQTILLYPSGAI
jgi:hypothetical protein